jgi:2,4-dienoyl-CoA reductase-like NADH-dependent reductase (Old Yellow Enzyme family)
MGEYAAISQLATAEDFVGYLERHDIEIPFDPTVETGPDAPLAQPATVRGFEVANRWAVLPMEGWDSDLDGNPTEQSIDRWSTLGRSGAGLIWGESAAVHPDGRSSPQQLVVAPETAAGLGRLRSAAVDAHRQEFGSTDGLRVGIQLVHSGRLSHPAPSGEPAPVAVRRHPYIDSTIGPSSDQPLLSDEELHALIDTYVSAAAIVAEAGFDFIDLKACHGSLGHELLGAYQRPGEFGGSFENRTSFLRTIVERTRSESPALKLALRLSAFDTVAHAAGHDGVGRPITDGPYRFWFGTDESGHQIDLAEPIRLLTELRDMGVDLICVTGSSSYNAWHLQRPALHSKPDEYLTPEDPLAGVARHILVTAQLRRAVPGIITVGSGYSYLQQWLPNVAQAAIRAGMTDLVGIARMQLASPRFIADVLDGRPLDVAAIAAYF